MALVLMEKSAGRNSTNSCKRL